MKVIGHFVANLKGKVIETFLIETPKHSGGFSKKIGGTSAEFAK